MANRRLSAPLAHLAIYLLAVVLGRSLATEGTGVLFFWPAAGIAGLWLLSGRTRGQVVLDASLLVAGTVVVDLVLGVDLVASVLFGVANLVVGLTVRLGSSLLEHRSFWGPLPRRIANSRDLWGVGVASVAAAVLSAVPGLLAVEVDGGTVTGSTAIGWLVRNGCSTFVVVASVLALMTTLFRAHARKSGWQGILVPEPRPLWMTELLWVVAASILGAGVLFGTDNALPVAYLMMVASTWIGYRFSPAVGAVYAMVFSTLAVVWTQVGSGPFGTIDDLTTRAIIVQVYIAVTTVLVLILSLSAYDRAALHARVIASESRATSRAELLDAVMNVMTDGLVVLEGSGEVMMRNPAAEAMMGPRRAPGADGPEDYGIYRLDGSSMAREELPHFRALQGEQVAAEDVLRIDPGTGQQAILSVGALPLRRPAEDGGTMAVVVIHDVTQERTQRRELQAFAGTVAHDLKAPLTGIGSWAEILGDQLDQLELDVTAPRSSLRRIETSATRMEQLIGDLLAYSQAQSATLAPVSLSLTGMVEQVARDLRETHADVRPIIEHGPLGQVVADRTLLSQLLTNVIGNAVKYVARGTTPHVMIGSELVGDMLEVRVADNGIGIPRAERGRIFDSFYRASSSGSYPGTGLGLAICARAVERHGGRISAREGLDGGGTTLVFTLPADLEVPETPGQGVGDTTRAEPPPRRTGSETAVS